MKHIKKLVGIILLFSLTNFSIQAESVHFGDYTTPGVITPDLVIIGGNLDLKDSCTVEGDLKIIGGYVSVASDNSSATTVDLYVNGDLYVTNTNVTGNMSAKIDIPTGKLVVTGEVYTRSEEDTAWIRAKYGIQAGRIETSGAGDAYVLAHISSEGGSIEVENDIVTNSGADGRVQTDWGNLRAGSIYTKGKGNADVRVGFSIHVRGPIIASSEEGYALVVAAINEDGGVLAAYSIKTTASITASVYAGSFPSNYSGHIDVVGDIVTTSSWETADVWVEEDGYIKAGSISTHGYDSSAVQAGSFIDVKGDINTYSKIASGKIKSANSSISARNITVFQQASDWAVDAGTSITARGDIVLKSDLGQASMYARGGDIIAQSISTRSYGYSGINDDGGSIVVSGPISAISLNSSADVVTEFDLDAGSVYTNGLGGSVGNVSGIACFGATGKCEVKGPIETRASTHQTGVEAPGDILAQSITSVGFNNAYIKSSNGSIMVDGDIRTHSLIGDAYVRALNGNINAQKIRTEAPASKDDSIQAAVGSAHFEFVPTTTDAAITIKDAEFTIDHDREWNTILTLQGTCTINGNGHLLRFSDSGGIIVDSNATLILKNIKMSKLGGETIRCIDNTGTFSLYDVTWSQTTDFAFKNGSLEIIGNFAILGAGTEFSYESTQVSTIRENAEFTISRGVTFNYNTGADTRLAMTDHTSRLYFDGANLEATEDIRLADGTIVIDNESTFNVLATKTITLVAASLAYEHHVGSNLRLTGAGLFAAS
jgi:hypothetical protein